MADSEGGRWTVFQRRMDGTVNFYRGWDQYKTGFGSPAGEYWLGLEKIHQLTLNRQSELLVQMEDFEGKKVFARYSSFSARLGVRGIPTDCFWIHLWRSRRLLTRRHNGQKFSTFDNDQDTLPLNCARSFLGRVPVQRLSSYKSKWRLSLGADSTLYALE
ncbi:hypothetical protein PFLUV_G00238720 [Perca fluviatilis]|uniref:Fibrinogen C-terminal domain-containing protein n=1 Tax=Perca fluviatilis TaxID=8168 RepID=A0A6A5EBM9_PERFL|nr:hypothetical protein PFLUV_G00238720 [Perca fluviatilis]